LDTTHIAEGKVEVSWKILEHDDAAVIQFILAGPSDTSISASGSLEGQRSVKGFQGPAAAGWPGLLAFACVFIVLFLPTLIGS
jgi:hypothetical protein